MRHTIEIDGQSQTLTTEHAAASYGLPVLVGPGGEALGPGDTCRLLVTAGSDEALRELSRGGYEYDDAR